MPASTRILRKLAVSVLVLGIALPAFADPHGRGGGGRGFEGPRREGPPPQARQERPMQRPEFRQELRPEFRREERPAAGVSPNDAARRAQELNGGGRILAVDPNGPGYRVKVLKEGEVRVISVPNGGQ